MPSSLPRATLQRQGHPLAAASVQLQVLQSAPPPTAVPEFDATLAAHGLPLPTAGTIEVLQVNVGKLCNQTCAHCHVDAGPERREVMSRETLGQVLAALQRTRIPTVDMTGGAPEMNPHFEWFVAAVRDLGRTLIDRCNLTILNAPGFTHLPEFLARHQVQIIASLPCYLEANCDRQRGDGVFRQSIDALRRLNAVGYAQPDSPLELALVYNPVGPVLPGDQQQLEAAYREQLRSRFGIEFTRLYTLTNMPISRFLAELLATGRYEEYMQRLAAAFNPAAAAQVMCLQTLSVDWRGRLFDCDFNQMLDLPIAGVATGHISELDESLLRHRRIHTARHCYGCTAGAGSSCQGALTSGPTSVPVRQ